MDNTVELLCKEPALAWKLSANVLGKDEDTPDVDRARAEVARRLAAAPPPPPDPAVGEALDAIMLAEAQRFGVPSPQSLLVPPR